MHVLDDLHGSIHDALRPVGRATVLHEVVGPRLRIDIVVPIDGRAAPVPAVPRVPPTEG